MGKRELFIVLAFVVVGAVAYQFTAPPSTSTGGYSFKDFFTSARREMRGNPSHATFTLKQSIEAPQSIKELRIIRVTHDVRVIGEARTDIAYELTTNSNGPDDATALEYAKRSVFTRDDVGDSLVLRMSYPVEANQTSSLLIRLPSRLNVRVEGAVGANVSGVAGVHLDSARGDVVILDISGAVTGTYQDGDLSVSGAGSVKMRLTRAQSRLDKILRGATLDLRDGDCEILESAGPLEVDQTRAELTVHQHRGPAAIRGADGSVTLNQPADESKIDMRRTEVEVGLREAMPVTVLTTDGTLRLVLSGSPSFALDAVATDGAIQASDVGLTPEVADREARLSHVFGARGGARVTLRNTGGDIVIRKQS